MKLVENWRQCWRWISVQLAAAAASIQLVMLALPADFLKRIPDRAVHGIAGLLLVGAVAGRLVDQTKTKPKRKKKKAA